MYQRVLPCSTTVGSNSPTALCQQRFQTVRDPFRLPIVREATRYAPEEVDLLVGLTQQESSTFGDQTAALELRHLAGKMRFKREESLATLVIEKAALRWARTSTRQRSHDPGSSLVPLLFEANFLHFVRFLD